MSSSSFMFAPVLPKCDDTYANSIDRASVEMPLRPGRIAAFKAAGHQLVVVVSAMSGETNRLVALAKGIQPDPDPREFDVVLATGEPVKMR